MYATIFLAYASLYSNMYSAVAGFLPSGGTTLCLAMSMLMHTTFKLVSFHCGMGCTSSKALAKLLMFLGSSK